MRLQSRAGPHVHWRGHVKFILYLKACHLFPPLISWDDNAIAPPDTSLSSAHTHIAASKHRRPYPHLIHLTCTHKYCTSTSTMSWGIFYGNTILAYHYISCKKKRQKTQKTELNFTWWQNLNCFHDVHQEFHAENQTKTLKNKNNQRSQQLLTFRPCS